MENIISLLFSKTSTDNYIKVSFSEILLILETLKNVYWKQLDKLALIFTLVIKCQQPVCISRYFHFNLRSGRKKKKADEISNS